MSQVIKIVELRSNELFDNQIFLVLRIHPNSNELNLMRESERHDHKARIWYTNEL